MLLYIFFYKNLHPVLNYYPFPKFNDHFEIYKMDKALTIIGRTDLN